MPDAAPGSFKEKIHQKSSKEAEMTREEFVKEFQQLCDKMAEVCRKKNSDYAGADPDPFANIKMVEKMGFLPAQHGIFVRLTDKFSRIMSFMEKGDFEVADEGIQDTCMDIAVYSLMLGILLRARAKQAKLNAPKSEKSEPYPATMKG